MARRKRTPSQPRPQPSVRSERAEEPQAPRHTLSPSVRKALLAGALGLEAVWLVFLVWMALAG